MRLGLSLMLVTAAVAVSAVFGAVGRSSPCRYGSALNLLGDCEEGEDHSNQPAETSNREIIQNGHRSVFAPDTSTVRQGTGGEVKQQQRQQQQHRRQNQRQGRRRLKGRRRGGRRRNSNRRRNPSHRQRVHDAAGLLRTASVVKGARRRRPCPKGYIRLKPRSRCFKRRYVSANKLNRDRGFQNSATSHLSGHSVPTSAAVQPSGSSSSSGGRRRCPGGHLRQSGGRCLQLGSESRPPVRRVPRPESLQETQEKCIGDRLAWENGKCVHLAMLRSCPNDSFRTMAGLCVRCSVTDKGEAPCAYGCAVDERRSLCICCQLNGDDP